MYSFFGCFVRGHHLYQWKFFFGGVKRRDRYYILSPISIIRIAFISEDNYQKMGPISDSVRPNLSLFFFFLPKLTVSSVKAIKDGSRFGSVSFLCIKICRYDSAIIANSKNQALGEQSGLVELMECRQLMEQPQFLFDSANT